MGTARPTALEEHDPEPERTPGGEPGVMRVRMLGGFRLSVGSRTVGDDAWRLKKAAALVKLLALAPGHALHREQVADLLWPRLDNGAASNNLRQALHAARRSVHPDLAAASRLVACSGERIVLCPEGELWVDACAFEEAAATARREKAPAAYRAALGLYAGELLPEDRYEGWAEERRQGLRETYLRLLVGLAAAHEARGDYGSALEALREAATGDPIREEAHAGLIRLYACSGRKGEALRQYEALRNVLSREFGVEPSASTRALREEISSGRFPPLNMSPGPAEGPACGPPRHNLPVPRTSFVGRERELLEVKRELSMSRLLTLTGAGGWGKTRLALEVARDLAGAYPDGVWLVELAPLSEPSLVAREAAGTLGVLERPGRPLVNALTDALRKKGLLLLLDNCEHLVEAAARLADALLGSCPDLRVLATSREPLGVEGELVWRVPPLPAPPLSVPRRSSTADELTEFAAVRLFVERARLKLPAFALTAENAGAVSGVCRGLEGVPLAVELAAARIGAMAAEHLAERLDDTLSLLSSGPRTASPRQRTMRATLEWSHGLLSEAERAAFRRLCVFVGGFSLEAAEAVLPGEVIAEAEVLDLISALVEKSLLVAEIPPVLGGGPHYRGPRYRMLEPLRQYAREKLEEGGEARTTREAHAAFFVKLAEEAEEGLVGPGHQRWLGRLEAEHDNLRGALSWSLDEGDPELGLRLAGALWLFWHTRGHLAEGRGWLEKALLRTARRVRPQVRRPRAKALEGAGYVVFFQGDYAAAKAFSEEGLTLYRGLGDEEGVASCLTNLGFLATAGQQDDIPLEDVLREALGLRPRLKNRHTIGWLLILAGLYSGLVRGEWDEYKGRHEEALALLGEINDVQGRCVCLCNLGVLATVRDETGRATALFEELMRLSRKLGNELDTLHALFGLACVAASEGRATRAVRLWGAAEALREADDLRIAPAAYATVGYENRVARVRDELGVAAFDAAWAEGKAMAREAAVSYALAEEAGLDTAVPAGTPRKEPATRQTLTRREEGYCQGNTVME